MQWVELRATDLQINASNMIMFHPSHCKTVEGQNSGLGKQTYGVGHGFAYAVEESSSLYVS
jgi:hypothetical protein